MADNDNVAFRHQLLSIDENLGNDDVENLKFLCSDFISLKKLESVRSAKDIFTFLINEDLINKDDTFLIAELLYIIVRNDQLKKLGYTKEMVQEELLNRGKVSGYRQLLYGIAQDLTTEDVKSATFLLRDDLQNNQPIMSALELLTSLEKKGLLLESNLDIIECICKKTAPCLLKKIEMYKKAKGLQGIEEPVPSSVFPFNKPTYGSTSLQVNMVVDTEQKTTVVKDLAVPSDDNIKKKECEKLENYQDMKEELERIWKVKPKMVPGAVDALDPVLPKNREQECGSLQEHTGNFYSLPANQDE